ncbi:unnamed protein product [Moneuplotes crassus]|uniref:ELMO domain-containing protein n=1 Tax=Euplotes crassus TaxID=5936 RepID=A0AAD2DBH5_EUPCR|nr:unnamed protein product [Moneuplotes crassus]
MDDIHLDFGGDQDTNADNGLPGAPLPLIDSTMKRIEREKASSLFTAMSQGIEQEQKKAGTAANVLEKQWEEGPLRRFNKEQKVEKEEASDSFEMDVDPHFLKKEPEEDSDDEFGIVQGNEGHNFKKLDKGKLMAYVKNDMSNQEREDYQKKLQEAKGKKDNLKKQNNIKGDVIVEDDEEESSEDEFDDEEDKGKIDQIFTNTMSEFNKTKKEEQKLQKEKEAAALAKLDILKAEQSKNKIISSAGKGLVTNNLSSKLKSITQKKEYDATKLVQEEAKAVVSNSSSPLKPSEEQKEQIPIIRKKITIKRKQIGILNFAKSALKCNLKIPNIFMDNKILNITEMNLEENKAAPQIIRNNPEPAPQNADSSPAVIPAVSRQNDMQQDHQSQILNQQFAAEDPMNKWMQVNKEREGEIQEKLNKNYDEEQEEPASLIRYLDAWMDFLTTDMSPYLDDIVRETGSSGGLMKMFKSKTSLDKSLYEERDIFMCLAKIKMDTSIETHDRVLSSIYMHLSGRNNCPRTGHHWIEVGFQNEDPQTDIRGSGMLGLMQMLYFCEQYNELASRYCNHSQIPQHKFPFIIKCFEFTTLVLNVLRSGKINKTCNQKGSIDGICNELYSACIWIFMTKYIKTQANIRHMNDLNKEVEDYIEKSPEKVLQQFQAFINASKNPSNDSGEQDFAQYGQIDSDEQAQPPQIPNRNSKYAM